MTRFQGYGIAVLCLVVAALCRLALLPYIGYGLIFGFVLIGVWVSGRYGGFGPSLLALVAGAFLALAFTYIVPAYDWTIWELQAGLILYLVLGVIVSLLCRSEHNARSSLLKQLAERIAIEEMRRESEERLQAIMDNTLAVIYVKDLQGRFLMVNKRFEALSTHGSVIGKSDVDLFPADVVAQIQSNDQKVRDTGRPLEFEEVVPQSDGLHTYVAVKFPIFDQAGHVTAIGGISTDISERKQAQLALEGEQELLQHTINAQDQERQLIAYEIHDGLIQYVTGALMQLEGFQCQENATLSPTNLDNVLVTLRRAVTEGRRLINGIRTPVLDGLGVVAAVENLIQEEERAHVEVEFVRDETLERLDTKVEEAIYRIAQEALTNVGKHSQSTRVRVELGRRGDKVHLEVRDWGQGFRPPNGAKGGVHGLRGMMERARIVGGTCKIESTPGEGTRITAELPFRTRT